MFYQNILFNYFYFEIQIETIKNTSIAIAILLNLEIQQDILNKEIILSSNTQIFKYYINTYKFSNLEQWF